MTIAFRGLLGAAGQQSTAPPVAGSFLYASSIDPSLTDLYAKYRAPAGNDLPVVVIMHGYVDGAAAVTEAIMQDMAAYGFFALAVGMRGRDGASGTPDVSGRELHDIVDAVEHVKTNFSHKVDPTRVHAVGYSGGGGNVFGLASKFPDYFTVLASHFGISDYGYDETYGWGEEVQARQESLATWIGYRARSSWSGSQDVNLAAYRARNAVEAIAVNRTGGHLYMFHDEDDLIVFPTQSRRVRDEFDSESNTLYTYDETSSSDGTRWLHDMPHPPGDPEGPPGGAPIRLARETWGPPILNQSIEPWTVPAAGELRVLGYAVTKHFQVWLGDGTAHVAHVAYDTELGEYTVTPLTGEMQVSVTQGGITVIETIDAETTITLPVVIDTFTGANGTPLATHAPDVDREGGGWGAAHGTYQIQDDTAKRTAAGDVTDGISIDTGLTEHQVTATVRVGQYGAIGLSTRVQDQDNHFFVSINENRTALALVERTGGAAQIRDSVAHAFDANTTYELTVTTTEDAIVGEVDGATVSYASSSKNANTRIGLVTPSASPQHSSDDQNRWWDDLHVAPLPRAGAEPASPATATHYAEITIPASQVPADQSGFVVRVQLSDMPPGFWSHVHGDGSDISIAKPDLTQLPAHVAYIDTSTEVGALDFKADHLSAASDTTFRVYYGSTEQRPPHPSNSTYGRNAVWSEYELVLNLNTDPTGSAPQYPDATGNGHHGTSDGAMTSGDLVSGPNDGPALELDGTNDRIKIPTTLAAALNGATAVTVTGTALKAGSGTDGTLFGLFGASSATRSLLIWADEGGGMTLQAFLSDGSTNVSIGASSGSVPIGDWFHYGVVFDASSASLRTYVDGVNGDTSTSVAIPELHNAGVGAAIGTEMATVTNRALDGRAEHIRVRLTAVTADWLAMEHTNLLEPSTFYSIGSQQDR